MREKAGERQLRRQVRSLHPAGQTCADCDGSLDYGEDVIVTYGRFDLEPHWATFQGSRKDGATRLFHPRCFQLDRGKLPARASRN